MIQEIRSITGAEFVCEVPEGWNAAFWDGKVVMIPPDGACPPRVLERDEDGVWRQREIRL